MAVRIAAALMEAAMVITALVIAALAADGRIGTMGDPQSRGNRLELARGEFARRNVNVGRKYHPFYS